VIVVDASAVVWTLVEWERSHGTSRLTSGEGWVAPSHIDLEVLNALRRYVFLKRLTHQQAEVALAAYVNLPIQRYELPPLLDRIWALRENLTAYDAAYVALAETLESELLTRDAKLAGARGLRVRIVLVR
jgi:predicted nucleic acid-binding protein